MCALYPPYYVGTCVRVLRAILSYLLMYSLMARIQTRVINNCEIRVRLNGRNEELQSVHIRDGTHLKIC